MSGTTAALIGALIGAVTALASGVLAGYVALRSERMRHREASKAAHAGSVREHTAAFFAELFAIHFAANWVAWFAAHDPGALDHGMAEFYHTETYRAFPKLPPVSQQDVLSGLLIDGEPRPAAAVLIDA